MGDEVLEFFRKKGPDVLSLTLYKGEAGPRVPTGTYNQVLHKFTAPLFDL